MNFSNITWTIKTYNEFIKYLGTLKDDKFNEFNRKIVLTNYKTLGIKIPILKSIAKEISKTDYKKFISLSNNSNIFEIVLIQSLLIASIKDYDEFEKSVIYFAPKIDSWAICDTLASSSKIINKNKERSYTLAKNLIDNEKKFTKRLGYIILLDYFVSDEYLTDIFKLIKNEKSEEYYVLMGIAWLLSVCYVKYESNTYAFLKNTKLNDFVLKKTISKINDSFRVSKESKLKVKDLLKRAG